MLHAKRLSCRCCAADALIHTMPHTLSPFHGLQPAICSISADLAGYRYRKAAKRVLRC